MTLFEPPGSVPSAARTPVDAGATQRCKLVVAYDGTDFHGFALQDPQRTVAGVLRDALAQVLQHDVDLTCAGRTDRGVHAWCQVVNLDVRAGADLERLRGSVSSMLGPEIVVRNAEFVPDDFSARFDARSRTYHYTIVNRDVPDPFRARWAWWIDTPLDLRALRIASDAFIGEHDFASFCRRPKGREPQASGGSQQPKTTKTLSTTRNVIESRWHDDGEGILRYEITAGAFCWQMVRSIVGTLAEVGMGKRRPGEMLGILRACDRSATSLLAPPHGLCLWEVAY